MLYLRYVTITGVDQRTDLERLKSLSVRYPFVEWGFLYSPSRAGNENRYMSVKMITDTVQSIPTGALNFSLHLCGSGAHDFLTTDINTGRTSNFTLPLKEFQRIQLNFNAQKSYPWDAVEVINACKKYRDKQIITQDNMNNFSVFGYMWKQPNAAALWDSSGGTGSATDALPPKYRAHRGIPYGFAGGINPDNVLDRLYVLDNTYDDLVTWIDMESGVRTDDWLDLDKVEAVLAKVRYSGVNI